MTSVGVGEGAAATKGSLTGKGRTFRRAYMTTIARMNPPTEAISFQGILLLPNSSPQYGQMARPTRISLLHWGQLMLSLRRRAPQSGHTLVPSRTRAPHHLQVSILSGPFGYQHESPHQYEKSSRSLPNIRCRNEPSQRPAYSDAYQCDKS